MHVLIMLVLHPHSFHTGHRVYLNLKLSTSRLLDSKSADDLPVRCVITVAESDILHNIKCT